MVSFGHVVLKPSGSGDENENCSTSWHVIRMCSVCYVTQASIPILVPRNSLFWSLCLETRGWLQIKPNCSKDENGAFPSPQRGKDRIGSSGEGRSRECAKFLALRSLGKMKQFPTFPKRFTTLTRYPGLSQSPQSVACTGQRIARPPPFPTRG